MSSAIYSTPSFSCSHEEPVCSSSIPPLEEVEAILKFEISNRRTTVAYFVLGLGNNVSTSIAIANKELSLKIGNIESYPSQPRHRGTESFVSKDCYFDTKFNSDPMNYWLFVRQYEAHVMGKAEDFALIHLLH